MLLPLMMMPGPCNDKDLSDDDIMGGGGVRQPYSYMIIMMVRGW